MPRSIPPLAAASLVLAACATVPGSPMPIAVTPTAGRLARLPPFDRGAVEYRGELVRLAAVPAQAARTRAAGSGRGRGRMASSAGTTIVVMNDRRTPLSYTYVGPIGDYQSGVLAGDLALDQALEKARAASAFHQPLKVRLGETDLWCVHDRVPRAGGVAPGYRLTLALFDHDPRDSARGLGPLDVLELAGPATEKGKSNASLGTACARVPPGWNQSHGTPMSAQGALVTAVASSGPAEQAGIRPGDLLIALDGDVIASPDDLVRVVSSRSPFASVKVALLRGAERKELPVTLGLRATSTAIVRKGNAGTPFTVSDVWLAPDGKLAGVSLLRWRPPAKFFLRGKTARDMWHCDDKGTEQAINDAVIEWKTRALPGWLRLATAEQLSQGIIDTEKGILALDLAVRTVKDQIDADARKNEITFAGAGEVEQLLEQRKMLLGVVLQAMKGAAAEKPGPL